MLKMALLSKNRYTELLRAQMSRDNNKIVIKVDQLAESKQLIAEIKKLNKQLKKLGNRKDQLRKNNGYLNWEAEREKVSKFEEDWDKVDLVVDVARRNKARAAMLKKYKLWN